MLSRWKTIPSIPSTSSISWSTAVFVFGFKKNIPRFLRPTLGRLRLLSITIIVHFLKKKYVFIWEESLVIYPIRNLILIMMTWWCFFLRNSLCQNLQHLYWKKWTILDIFLVSAEEFICFCFRIWCDPCDVGLLLLRIRSILCVLSHACDGVKCQVSVRYISPVIKCVLTLGYSSSALMNIL